MGIKELKNNLPGILSCTSLKKESVTSYAGPCPRCGGTDRFVYKTDTKKFWCRHCHKNETKPKDIVDFHCWLYGKTLDDLFAEYLPGNQKKVNNKFHHFKLGYPVKIYPYHDQDESILYNVCRFEPKKFRPCDPGGEKWKVKGIKPVPYNLPALIKAKTVFLCEGEKDADTINEMGLIGTCKANWTGKWSKEFAGYFKNKTVFILQDSDQAGDSKARDAAQILSQDKSINIKIVPAFSKQKGFDVSDWIQDGHTKDDLLKLVDGVGWFKNKTTDLPQGFTAQELLNTTFPEPRWAVKDILPEGLNIIGGKPKAGKSIIGLNLALAISLGGKALQSVDVERGSVIYLALEDTPRRLKKRIEQMLQYSDEVPANLQIFTTWPRMGHGGVKALDSLIKNTTDIRLVIVDTLAKIRPPGTANGNLYTEDYETVSQLKKIADDNEVSILLIHHLRKMFSSDVFDMFSGTFGLSGAADGLMVMARNRAGQMVFSLTGRDVENQEFILEFDPKMLSWRLVGKAAEVKSTDERQKLFDALKEAEEGLSPKHLAEVTKLKLQYIKNTLPKLLENGEIKKVGRGKYMSTMSTLSTSSTLSTLSTFTDSDQFFKPETSKVLEGTQERVLLNPLTGKPLDTKVPKVLKVLNIPEDSDAEYF